MLPLWVFVLASHSSQLLLCLPTDGVARIYLFYLLNTLEHHFNVSWFNLFLTPIPEREKNHLNRRRPRESNPGLLRGTQVRYPLHQCLSGNNLRVIISKYEGISLPSILSSALYIFSKLGKRPGPLHANPTIPLLLLSFFLMFKIQLIFQTSVYSSGIRRQSSGVRVLLRGRLRGRTSPDSPRGQGQRRQPDQD